MQKFLLPGPTKKFTPRNAQEILHAKAQAFGSFLWFPRSLKPFCQLVLRKQETKAKHRMAPRTNQRQEYFNHVHPNSAQWLLAGSTAGSPNTLVDDVLMERAIPSPDFLAIIYHFRYKS